MPDQKKVIFLDRDGVINKDHGYVGSWSELEYFDDTISALKKLKYCKLVIITNQSGIARGYYSETQFHQLQKSLIENLASYGIEIGSYYYCPHHPEAKIEKYRKQCNCRKPNPGMLFRAAKDLNIDLSEVIFVGDRSSDMRACRAARIEDRFIVNYNSFECKHAKRSFKSLSDFVTFMDTLYDKKI